MNTTIQYIVQRVLRQTIYYNGTITLIIPEKLKVETNIKKDKEKAFKNSIKIHEYNKKKDKNRKEINLKGGDLVYIKRGNELNRGKVDIIRVGPFPISEVVSKHIYKINQNNKKKDNKSYHVSKMVPGSNEEN